MSNALEYGFVVLIAEAKELVFAYGNSLTEKGDYCNKGFNYKGIFNYTCSMSYKYILHIKC